MQKKSRVILPIATALGALFPSVAPEQASAATPQKTDAAVVSPDSQRNHADRPNVVFTAGEDLLGMVVTRRQDGTVVAAHYSHVSHASHHSHHSHYSSR
jgi:hypothetical protein